MFRSSKLVSFPVLRAIGSQWRSIHIDNEFHCILKVGEKNLAGLEIPLFFFVIIELFGGEGLKGSVEGLHDVSV